MTQASWLRKNCISLLALIISIAALSYTHKQSSLASKQAHLHIEPVIKTYFDLPKEKNPVFVIANEGDIQVVSVSVGNRVFVFDKNIGKITSAAEAGRLFSPGAIFRENLKPTEYEDLELLKVSSKENLIVVYEFFIKYFRENDMKEFERTGYFQSMIRKRNFLIVESKYSRIIDVACRIIFLKCLNGKS